MLQSFFGYWINSNYTDPVKNMNLDTEANEYNSGKTISFQKVFKCQIKQYKTHLLTHLDCGKMLLANFESIK